MDQNQTSKFQCPACGANPGQCCRTSSGQPMKMIHRDRYVREFSKEFQRKAREYHVGGFTVRFRDS